MSEETQKTKKPFFKRKWVWGVGILLLLIIIVAASGSEDTSTQSPSAEDTPVAIGEVMEVNITAFVAEFDRNQLAAEEKYENKHIRFTGEIKNISQDIVGKFFLSMQPIGAGEYYFGTTIQCYFNDRSSLTSLENGQRVTLQGKVTSQTLGSVLVENCSVVSE